MASIKKFHLPSCGGSDCECLWVLDYRPLGMFGTRRRVRFKTRKQAEHFLTETAHRAARGEYAEPAKIPTFAVAAERWFASKTDRRPSHVADLRSRLDKHLLPRLAPNGSTELPLRRSRSCATTCAQAATRHEPSTPSSE